MAHHQESDRVHTEVTGGPEVASGQIGFGAVGTHSHHARAGAVRVLEVGDAANPGQQQCRHPGAIDSAGDSFDPLQIGVRAKAVTAARPAQAVTVGDLDGVDPRIVERPGNRHGLGDAVLVTHRVHAVAQGDVADVQIANHSSAFTVWAWCSTIASAVALAADVTIATFPAQAGR